MRRQYAGAGGRSIGDDPPRDVNVIIEVQVGGEPITGSIDDLNHSLVERLEFVEQVRGWRRIGQYFLKRLRVKARERGAGIAYQLIKSG